MATKVILDTNLWSYVGDEESVGSLQEVLKRAGCVVALAPSMLIELLRNPHQDSRARHIAAITSIKGDHLASEAELCARDFIKMVERLRPHWKRAIADMATVAKYHREWTRDVWRWAASDPEHAHLTVTRGTDVSRAIVDVQRRNRKSFLKDNFASDYLHLLAQADSPEDAARYIPGWDGREIDAWRFDLAARYWFNMTTRRGNPNYTGLVQTNRDWIGSRIDLETATADAEDFARMWFEEATPADVCWPSLKMTMSASSVLMTM